MPLPRTAVRGFMRQKHGSHKPQNSRPTRFSFVIPALCCATRQALHKGSRCKSTPLLGDSPFFGVYVGLVLCERSVSSWPLVSLISTCTDWRLFRLAPYLKNRGDPNAASLEWHFSRGDLLANGRGGAECREGVVSTAHAAHLRPRIFCERGGTGWARLASARHMSSIRA